MFFFCFNISKCPYALAAQVARRVTDEILKTDLSACESEEKAEDDDTEETEKKDKEKEQLEVTPKKENGV